MILDALQHVPDCFEYMQRLRTQSVFNFCAIPQVMAIATLELCYNNTKVLKQNVKIRKGLAVTLMMDSTNVVNVVQIFMQFASRLKDKVIGAMDAGK